MHRLGRYEILEELGHGAMGTVYRARDPKIDRVVALKTINLAAINPADEESFRQRFFREAQAAGRLSHPAIVTIHDVGEEESTRTPYIVMEFIEGRTLDALCQGERLPQETALDAVKHVAEALDYAHSRGIVHRDIKPANILITPDGRPKITDFGIAKLETSQFTQPGQVLGTPAYMAPEQISGGTVDARSDLFSLGVVLYWLLTGDKPFPGDTATSISFKVVYQDPILPTRLNPALSPHFDHVVARALAKDPAQRYQRGQEMADDLEDLKSGRPPRSRAAVSVAPAVAAEGTRVQAAVVASPPSAAEKTPVLPHSPLAVPRVEATAVVSPPSRKRRWLVPATVAALLLLLFGAGVWWWLSGSAGEKSQPAVARPAATSASTSPARTRPAVTTATLRLRGEQEFESATLYVYADDDLVKQIALSAGRISASVPVSAGARTIGIRLRAASTGASGGKKKGGPPPWSAAAKKRKKESGGGFDETETIRARLGPGGTRTLEVRVDGELSLRWLD